ncbi:hypothetical protein GTA07_01075 [Rhodococcus hoagii]|nr:hypothetical protein [Prescottella equi]
MNEQIGEEDRVATDEPAVGVGRSHDDGRASHLTVLRVEPGQRLQAREDHQWIASLPGQAQSRFEKFGCVLAIARAPGVDSVGPQ